MISLAWPFVSSSFSYIELHNIFNQGHWKITQKRLFHMAWENVKALQRDASASLPPFLSSRTFQLLGTLKFHCPVTVEMERAVRHKVRTCEAAGELSAARKRSFQYQGPWGSGPRALCATATGVGSNCVCDL